MANILIVGYYGYSNSGDDAILSSICHDIKEIDQAIGIGVLSNNPKLTEEDYQVVGYKRFSIKQIFQAVKSADLVLLGGGSLLQDGTSSRSLYYYLFVVKLALILKKKVMLYANGIGPIYKSFNKKITASIINKVDCITLRESLSARLLDEMAINKPKIIVTSDPVFGLDVKQIEKEEKRIEIPKMPYLAVMVRSWKDSPYIKPMADVFDGVIEKFHMPLVFVPMKYPADLSISKEIQAMMKNDAIVIEERVSMADMFEIIGNAKLVLSMRLHALIYSAIKSVPMIGFEYDPKVQYYMDALEMPLVGDLKALDVDLAINKIVEVMERHDYYVKHLTGKTDAMRSKSKQNQQTLKDLLNQ